MQHSLRMLTPEFPPTLVVEVRNALLLVAVVWLMVAMLATQCVYCVM